MSTQLAPAYADIGLFIGGEWVAAGNRKTSPVINPATEETIGQVPHATTADLDRALEAAQKGFQTWRAVFPDQRGKVLKKAAELMRSRAEEIARIATIEIAIAAPDGGLSALLKDSNCPLTTLDRESCGAERATAACR